MAAETPRSITLARHKLKRLTGRAAAAAGERCPACGGRIGAAETAVRVHGRGFHAACALYPGLAGRRRSNARSDGLVT
jgi:hypothetical protein